VKKEKVIKRLYQLGIFTLITSFIWVALSGYHQLIQKQQIKGEDKALIKPIQPNLRSELLPTIQARREYKIEEVSQSLIKPTATPTPTPTTASEPTPSVVPTSAPGQEAEESTGSG
jgi:hypothetical protein